MSDRRLLAGALAAFGLFLAFLMAIGGPPQSARTPAAYPVATALVTREAGGPSARRGAQVSRAVSFHTGNSAAQALDYYERLLTAGWLEPRGGHGGRPAILVDRSSWSRVLLRRARPRGPCGRHRRGGRNQRAAALLSSPA